MQQSKQVSAFPTKQQRIYQPLSYLINFILIFRPYYTEIPLLVFITIFVLAVIGKYYRQGHTIQILGQFLSFLVIILGQLTSQFVSSHLGSNIVTIGVFINVLNYMLMAPTIYRLPFDKIKANVGLREGVKNISKKSNNNSSAKNQNNVNSTKQLYWTQWYPTQLNQNEQFYSINWAHTVQLKKMIQFMKLPANNTLFFQIFKFVNSVIARNYYLRLSKSPELSNKNSETDNIMLFSHGRSGTPFMYSSYLMGVANTNQYKVYAPQHSEVAITPYNTKQMEKIKDFREKQVKERARELITLTQQINLNAGKKKRIVLMGHSYGCATIIQSYNNMHLSLITNIKGIILLDPWLFPLIQQQLQKMSIHCPILMLVNEKFIAIEDIYERNRRFLANHRSNMIYVCWKDGDHIQQTDMQFIAGTTLGIIKNVKNSQLLFNDTMEIIDMFLKHIQQQKNTEKTSNTKYETFQELRNKVLQKSQAYNLGPNYIPKKWMTKFTF